MTYTSNSLNENLKFGNQCFSLGWSEVRISLWLEREMRLNNMSEETRNQIYRGYIEQEKRG